jgi:hypothetical protein
MGKFKRWLWPALCASLAVGWAWTATLNDGLRGQVSALRQVTEIQDRWCTGLGEVNTVCEETLADLAGRLGLDRDFMPLVTTALWRRSMPRVTVGKARRLLGGPSATAEVAVDPTPAMGGGEEELPKRGRKQ